MSTSSQPITSIINDKSEIPDSRGAADLRRIKPLLALLPVGDLGRGRDRRRRRLLGGYCPEAVAATPVAGCVGYRPPR